MSKITPLGETARSARGVLLECLELDFDIVLVAGVSDKGITFGHHIPKDASLSTLIGMLERLKHQLMQTANE